MEAAVLRVTREPLIIEGVELDCPRAEEVRIRVVAIGLCHSDLHFINGDFPGMLPLVLSHEAAGIVVAVGEKVRRFRVGGRVVTCVSAFCGECGHCQSGHSHRCDDRPGRDLRSPEQAISRDSKPIYRLGNLGSFAEEMVVHSRAVSKLPDEIPFDAACLLGCDVITGAGAVLNGGKVEQGSSVAGIGCGDVGLNVIQAARIAGAIRIIAIDAHPTKLELAKTFVATHSGRL